MTHLDDTKIREKMNEVIEGCMGEAAPGCVATCPMHTNVKEYVRLIREDQGKEAIKVIREKLFIPGVLGRICAHPCEKECKWNEEKKPISIATLKRYASDNFDDKNDWDYTKKEATGKKVAVVGAGPSGAQTALDLVREGHQVTLFEKLDRVGGMMRVGIPEYRLPRHIIDHEYSYLEKLGVEFKLGVELGKDITLEEMKAQFDAVVIAIGKHVGRVDRSLENHQAKGIYSAAEFLKQASMQQHVEGVGRKVLVIGGGDVAMDCARVARRLKGVAAVTDICLEANYDQMFASNHEVQGALREGISFLHATAIKEIKVDETGRVNGISTKYCKSMFDEDKRFLPQFDETIEKQLDVDTIVFAIGQGVDATFAQDNLPLRPNGTFECDELTLQSSNDPQIFFAGDVSGGSVIVIQAMATGRRVAESVCRYLDGKDLKEGRSLDDTKSYPTRLKRDVDWDSIDKVERKEVLHNPEATIENFKEVDLGYTKEVATEEAKRCLQCQCRLCMKECMMLPEYTESPKRLFEDYLDTGILKKDHMIAYSCNECSQCTNECPKDFDLKEIFKELKKTYAKTNDGLATISVHQDYDVVQEKECSDKYCVTVPVTEEPARPTKYLFVPGCTVPAYSPENVENVLKHLRETLDGEVGVMLRCCGKVSLMMGHEEKFKDRYQMAQDEIDAAEADVIVTICPSCYKIYSQYGDRPVISYWELMQQKIGLPKESVGVGQTCELKFNINDPCATRDVPQHHEAIRWMMDEMGYKVEEMKHIKGNTRCCGVGGMSCTANPGLYEKIMERRKGDCTQEQIVTYCGSCRGTFEAMGKDALHITDLLFKKEAYKKEDARIRAPKDIWENRLDTKERFETYKK